ncbi:MAG: SRPBCC family protein [Bacteroidetes bacterium]|nr:SRPBCC family protein [Bacteroidota bacterium]
MINKIYRTQIIPTDVSTLWDYISSPKNLQAITPEGLGFTIISDELGKMYSGQMIHYIVKPLLGIPVQWLTEITHIEEGKYFVVEQRVGPYKLWHHEHFIMPHAKGVEMVDLVHYQLPLGIIGDVMIKLIVEKKLKHIFDYRYKSIENIFSKT